MDWQIFAMMQMALIMISVSVAFVLHNRKLNRQNVDLREHLAALEAIEPPPEHPDPADWTKAHVDAFEDESPAKALVSAVMANALEPKDSFASELPELLEKCGFEVGSGGDDEALAAAEAEIADLKQQIENQDEASAADDLKTLLQQFTHDSREMMHCIQQLEKENAQLRQQLGDDAPPVTPESDNQTATSDEQVADNSEDQAAATETVDLDEAPTETEAKDAADEIDDILEALDEETAEAAEASSIDQTKDPTQDPTTSETSDEPEAATEPTGTTDEPEAPQSSSESSEDKAEESEADKKASVATA